MDNSKLNNKYFIDEGAFNCPFCGLRNAAYLIRAVINYDVNNTKKAKIIFIGCNRCGKTSIHFVNDEIPITPFSSSSYIGCCIGYNNKYGTRIPLVEDKGYITFLKSDGPEGQIDIDSHIFHSVPSSFFTMDERIPKEMRELFDEAQESKRANLKTGASACLRKLIYTFLHDQLNMIAGNKAKKKSLKELGHEHYNDCIGILKKNYPHLEVFFLPIESITGITSDQVHEESWKELSSNDLDICFAVMSDILDQVYVQPCILEDRKSEIEKMKAKSLYKK